MGRFGRCLVTICDNLTLRFLAILTVLAAGTVAASNPLTFASGSWYDPTHDGEGWVVQVFDETSAVMIWFSYTPEGQQAWFLGVGKVSGDSIEIEEMLMPSGTRFGEEFSSDQIEYPVWGSVKMDFSDCANGVITYNSDIEGYGSGQLNMTRLTDLAGVRCE